MPELAEAGYNALWLPPPFKAGAGTWSVGFDTYDRFDLGNKFQMGTVPTKYGTEVELMHLMRVAHRFGFRVYFDNIMAHNGGTYPVGAPGTLFDNGFVPEDFSFYKGMRGRDIINIVSKLRGEPPAKLNELLHNP